MTIEKIDLFDSRHVVAFSTLRNTENPKTPYDGFSICSYTGDNPDHITTCRACLCRMLGIENSHLITPRQTHSCNVALITQPPTDTQTLENVDGLVTNLRGIALSVNTADCVPIVMADETAGVIAAVHSGWRGTVGGIAVKAVAKMIEAGANSADIKVAMGPSICCECFEVGNEVADVFGQISQHARCISYHCAKPHIDLGLAIRSQLINAGIAKDNISLPSVCSRCNSDTLFSARKHGIASGRTATVIMLR